MKTFKFTISGNKYEVEVQSLDEGIAKIEVNGTQYHVELEKQVQSTKTPVLVRSKVKNPAGSHKIKKTESLGYKVVAPLPGNIMQLFVKEGDAVSKGDKLLIYEAMKMENELKSEKDGVITAIKVSLGDSVLQDEVLIEMQTN